MTTSVILLILGKVTVTTAMGLAAAHLARRRRASVRHVLLTATFAVVVALPLASFFVPAISVVVPAVAGPTTAPPTHEPLLATDRDAAAPSQFDASPAMASRSVTPPVTPLFNLSASAVLLAVWVAGTALFLLPVVIGLAQVRALRRSGLPWSPGRIVVDAMALDAGIRRRVDVLLHESTPGPLTFGIVRPTILLPPDAEGWRDDDLRRAITHELEHVRRGDWISQCVARAICAIYWFHPLVWIAWRQFSLEAERACDDAVLRRSEATAYADQLVGLARRLSAGQRQPLLAMANRADLSTRVVAVLDAHQPRGRAGTRAVAIGCAVAALLVLGISPLRVVVGAEPVAGAAGQQGLSPKFDVVSIKPCLPGGDSSMPAGGRGGAGANHITVSPGNVYWSCVPLSDLIDQAYGGGTFPNNSLLNTIRVPPNARPDAPKRVRGGPSWVQTDRFTIEIKLSGDKTDLTGSAHHDLVFAAMIPALRAMIEDRFQLKLRKVTEQVPMYALTVAQGGLKIPRCWERNANVPPDQATPPPGFEGAPPCDFGVTMGPRQVGANPTPIVDPNRSSVNGGMNHGNMVSTFRNTNLTELAAHLSRTMDRYVLDKSSLEGRFSFKLEYAPDDNTPADIQWFGQVGKRNVDFRIREGLPPAEPVKGDGPTIFRALEALGLKLESTRGPAEHLFIESVQKPRPDGPMDIVEPHVAGASRLARAKGAGR